MTTTGTRVQPYAPSGMGGLCGYWQGDDQCQCRASHTVTRADGNPFAAYYYCHEHAQMAARACNDSAAETWGLPPTTGKEAMAMPWTLLGTWGVFEYWQTGDDVYRRKVSSYNYSDHNTGAPMNARYECSLAHFQRYVAGTLPV